MSVLLFLLLAALLAAFWYDSLGARECALEAGRRACRHAEVQLLDQTVALARLGLRRDRRGRLRLTRCYQFEFSRDGSDRWLGRVLLLGQYAESVQLEHPDGLLILPHGRPTRAAAEASPPQAPTP